MDFAISDFGYFDVSKLLTLGLLVLILAFGDLSTLCEFWNAGLRDLEVLRRRDFETT